MSEGGEKPMAAIEEHAERAVLPDGDLLRAFESLRDELVSTLWFVLGNRDDAQDTAQETFLKCWRTRASLDKVHNLRAWIFRVGLNAAKDLQRSPWRRRAKPLTAVIADARTCDATPGHDLETREIVERVRLVLFALRPEEQEVFLLRQNGELTYEQIAEQRRCPVGTIKTQMRAALHKIRQAMG